MPADEAPIQKTTPSARARRRLPAERKRLSRLTRINLAIIGLGLILLAGWLYLLPLCLYLRYTPREGDLVFQSLPRGRLVNTIEGVSGSPLSHCGIVVERDGEWKVLEAIGPVKETSLLAWIRRGRGYRFEVYRLRETHDVHIDAFIAEARRYLGKPYDPLYELDDDKLYCSELIYTAFQTATGEPLGELAQLGTMNWQPFKEHIKELAGMESVPTGRLLITPIALTRAPQLERVHSGGF